MMQNNKRFFPNKLPLAAAVTAAIMATPAIAVEFHGYARSGLSTNTSSGGEQTCFGSGANGHFVGRLADECDTYAELAFGDQLFSQDGKTFRFDSMVPTKPSTRVTTTRHLTAPTMSTASILPVRKPLATTATPIAAAK